METQEYSLRVLMFPWLGHGHISPYLDLAKKLSQKNIYIYFCSTPINLTSIKKMISETDDFIELVELHLPSLPDLPPQYHTAIGLPSHLFPTLLQALDMSSSNFCQILENLKPDLVIYDLLQPWVPNIAMSYHIPAVHFQCSGAAAMAFMFWPAKNSGFSFPYPDIYLRDNELKKMQENSIVHKQSVKEVSNWFEQSTNIVLMRTFREIEEKYIDMYPTFSKKKIVLVGPQSLKHIGEGDKEDEEFCDIFQWLSEKKAHSTVLVSFGSECYLSKKELEELAFGLELSTVNFIWVIRFPGGQNISLEDALPEGFVDRIKERGLIVEGWAPQTKILGHKSIGGFVSHCGWGSVLESIYYGVPIIAIPMHNDQPLNARLAVKVGVCLEVLKDENLEFGREEVARVVKEVVVEKSGESLRRKAKELSEKINMKGEEEIDGVVEELKKICCRNMEQ